MSEARHRLKPAHSAIDLASYPPPIVIRSIDFDAVAPARRSDPPAPYLPPRALRVPSGAGPDQWEEDQTPTPSAHS